MHAFFMFDKFSYIYHEIRFWWVTTDIKNMTLFDQRGNNNGHKGEQTDGCEYDGFSGG